ncbi:MAG: hypothetical protein ACRD3W_07965, partial [Terriglobales bacterium]
MRKTVFWIIAIAVLFYSARLMMQNWVSGQSAKPVTTVEYSGMRQRRTLIKYLQEKAQDSSTVECFDPQTGHEVSPVLTSAVELRITTKTTTFDTLLKASKALDSALRQARVTRICFSDTS